MFEPYNDFLYRVTRTGFPSSYVQSVLGSNTSANSISSDPQGNQPSNSSNGNTAEQSAEEIKVEFDPCQYLCEYDMKPTPAEVFVAYHYMTMTPGTWVSLHDGDSRHPCCPEAPQPEYA